MAKEKGKKLKGKERNMNQPNAKIKKNKKLLNVQSQNAVVTVPVPASAPLTDPAQASTSAPPTEEYRAASQTIDTDKDMENHLSGFIFMCNRSTKPECYQYRVFGLPLGKKEVVEAIKPGSKLFLFDFELKLLYGVYEATSAGTVNLEPNSFRGKFPAQVKFKIFKECLPLHESSFRHVLKENYEGRKFKQELSGKQVRNLLSSFRPLAASSQRAPPTLPNVVSVSSRARHPLAVEDQHAAGLQYYPGPPVMENWPLVHIPQHKYHGAVAYIEHAHPATEHQGLPGNNLYYVAESRQPHFSEGLVYAMQAHHPRYVPVQARGIHAPALGLTSDYHRLPGQVEVLRQDEVVSNSAYSAPSAQYASSIVQPQQVYSSAQYASSAAQQPQQVYSSPQYASSTLQQPQQVYSSTQYTSSAVQPPQQAHSSTQYASSAVQQPQQVYSSTQYVPSVVQQPQRGYSSTQYASSVVQPQQGYSSFRAPAVPYAESAVQLQAPASVQTQGSVPISSYYMFSSPAGVYH